MSGTEEERTQAQTYLGSVLEDVAGNEDINGIAGAVNTFGVGLSTSKNTNAKTMLEM